MVEGFVAHDSIISTKSICQIQNYYIDIMIYHDNHSSYKRNEEGL
jgi:hypothetical protein